MNTKSKTKKYNNTHNIVFYNFLEVYKNKNYLLLFFITLIIISSIFIKFTNIDIIQGNFSNIYLYTQIILQILISILFSIYLPISIYKIRLYKSIPIKENLTSSTGTILGILVAGCPACSITLASYLGLASIISFLPYYGLELKIIAIPLLIYSNYSLLKNLKICNRKLKK